MGGRLQGQPQVPFHFFHGSQTMVAAESTTAFQSQPESELHVALFSPQELRQQELPPSERDFQVFEEVVIGGASTRAAAALFGVSQTRIVQVRQRVAEWIGAEVPPTPRLTPLQRLRLAAHIAEQRADFLYSKAMDGWRASQQPLTSICRGRLGEETRTRERHGDPRYLMAAMRITERQVNLAGTIRKVLVEAEERESGDGSREAEVQGSGFGVQEEQQETVRPPVGACSLDGAGLGQDREDAAVESDVSDSQEETCDELENRRREFLAALQDDTAPVQPPRTDGNGTMLEASLRGEPAFAPAESAVAPAATLNRHQRRARQRMLARKLRKAK
jgi:hypothetical protein